VFSSAELRRSLLCVGFAAGGEEFLLDLIRATTMFWKSPIVITKE